MKHLAPSTCRNTLKFCFGLVLTVFACSVTLCLLPGNAVAQPPAGQKMAPERFRRVLLLPAFDMSRIHGENVTLMGPLSGNVFVTSKVTAAAADEIYGMLKKSLARIENLELVPAAKGDLEFRAGVDPITGHRSERIAAVQKVGRQSRAEAVICTYVYGFRERVGTAYGADHPARVSFELNMIEVATGRIVWQDHYSETQQTLNENVLQLGKFLKRKGRWVTAEEIAAGAVNDLIGSLKDQFFKSPP